MLKNLVKSRSLLNFGKNALNQKRCRVKSDCSNNCSFPSPSPPSLCKDQEKMNEILEEMVQKYRELMSAGNITTYCDEFWICRRQFKSN